MRWCAAMLGVILAVFLPVFAWADDPVLVIDSGGHLALIKDIMFTSDGKYKVWSAAFSPNGRYLASGSYEKTVRLSDARTGKAIKILARQETDVVSLSFSPDSRWLLTGAGEGGNFICKIFAVPSGKVISHFRHTNVVLATAIAPDGKMVAPGGGSNQEIFLSNPQTGKLIRTLAGKGQPVWNVGFARNGRSIAFGNTFDKKNDNNRGLLQHTLLLNQEIDDPVFLGREVGNEADYLRTEVTLGKDTLQTKQGGQYGLQVILQILRAGKVLHEIERDSTTGFAHLSYTFTHDGRSVISGSGSGGLTLYNPDTGRRVHDFVGHTDDVWTVAVASDNRTLVSGSADQTVRFWDIATGQNLLTVFVGSDQEWVAWTPQGYYTSSSKGDRYIGWHVNQGADKAATYYSAAQFQSQFYRPDVVAAYLQTRDIQLAGSHANAARGGSVRPQPVLTAADVANFLPPQVVVIAPDKPESTVQQAVMTVKAEAVSQTLPISDVEVHLNGIQIAGGAQGKSRGEQLRHQVELEVTLEPGINTLTFIAKYDKASSAPLFRRLVYNAPAKEERPNLRLLSIGISRYKDPSFHLDFARQDAIDITKTFVTQEGRLFRKVMSEQLRDEHATRAEILRKLNWLKEGTQRDYRLLFLSGHGGMDRQQNYYFFAHNHDTTQDLEISNIKRNSILERLTATPGKAILMIDTCRAATLTSNGKVKSTVNFDQILREMQSDYRGLVTFAASTGKQVSREKPEWGHGAFTKAVLEGLLECWDGNGCMATSPSSSRNSSRRRRGQTFICGVVTPQRKISAAARTAPAASRRCPTTAVWWRVSSASAKGTGRHYVISGRRQMLLHKKDRHEKADFRPIRSSV